MLGRRRGTGALAGQWEGWCSCHSRKWLCHPRSAWPGGTAPAAPCQDVARCCPGANQPGAAPAACQALPSPRCHQLLLAGSLVPTDEPWPGSTCPVLAARGASPPHPQPGGQRGAEALGRAVAVSALCCVQEVLDHCPGAACRAASPCASPHLLTSAPRMQRERRVCRSRIHHVLPRGLCCLQEGDSECLALRTAGG